MESAKLIETVKKAQNGDDDALKDLYLDTYRSVYYLALKTLNNREDAEDITQEVFIAMREKIAELREPATFYRWLNRVTANKCANLLKKHRTLTANDNEEILFEPEEENHLLMPDKAFDDAETRRLIGEVIDNLPDNQRSCIYFYYYQQMTIAQISEELGVNENTVKSRLTLARGKIKTELERKEREEGIRLYAVPLALTPILRKAFDEFVMPDGVAERMWEYISIAKAGDLPSDNSSASGNGGSPSASGGTSSMWNAIAGKAAQIGVTKTIIGLLVVAAAAAVVTAAVIFLPPLFNTPDNTTPLGVTETPTGTENPFDKGTYEGEYDTNGKRSGYGVWIYDNIRYEGYFENDMPNGTGILYQASAPPTNRQAGHTYTNKVIVSGNWVNGLSDGTITLKWVMENGNILTWTIETVNGCPPEDGIAYTEDGRTNMNYKKDQLMGGVPPWADNKTNPSIAAPSATEQPDDWKKTPGAPDSAPVVADESGRGERPDFGSVEKPSYTKANIYGNTNGNIGNLGYVAIQGDWIYYQNVNHDRMLYAMKTDGSCNQKLSNDVPLFINVVGDWVYYVDALAIQNSGKKTNRMYKVNIDGSGRQRICEDSVDYMTVVGDSIYYCNYDDDFKLYAIKTDGTGRKKLCDDLARFPVVSGDSIYYSDGDNLYTIQTDGTGRRIVVDHLTVHINVDGNKVYYTRAIDFMETIYVRNTDGSGSTFGEILYYHDARYFNVSGGRIFYSESDSHGMVAVMNADTSGLEVFDSELYAQYLNMVGDWILYLGGDAGSLYAIKTDGTENHLAGGPPETAAAITVPEADMVSAQGVYYQGEQMIYTLPDELVCNGVFGFEGSYITTWAKNLNIDHNAGTVTVDESIQFSESAERITDFETRKAEDWYVYGSSEKTIPPSVSDLSMVKSTIDGCPAVRLSYKFSDNDNHMYCEQWIIGTPNGSVIISMSMRDTLVENARQFSEWAAGITSDIWIDQ